MRLFPCSLLCLFIAVGAVSCRSFAEREYTPPPPPESLGREATDPVEDVGERPGERELTRFAPPDEPVEAPETGPLRIAVEDAVMLALDNNRSLRVQRMEPIIAGTFEDLERGVFDPRLFGESSFGRERTQRFSEDAEVTFPVTTERLNTRFGFIQSLPTGTEVELGLSHSLAMSDRVAEDQHTMRGSLTVTQALLQGRSREANLVNLRQAQLDTQASEFELRGFAEALMADVETTYWDYVLARREVEIFEESLSVADRHLDATRERIEVGQLAETELAAAEAEVALRRQALINARSREESFRLALIRLLNPEPGEDGWGRRIEVLDDPSPPEVDLDDVALHVQLARSFRPEVHEANLRLAREGLEVVQTRNGLLPQLDFFVTLGKSGFADSFGRSARDIDGDSYDATVGVRGEYALGRREDRARARRARATERQAEESIRNLVQLVELDVRVAYVETSRARQQIDASAATRRLQEEAFRAESEKFDVGLSTVLDVATVQRDLLESQLAEVEAVIDYRKALIDLYRLEGSLLKRRGIGAPGDRHLPERLANSGF